MPGTATGTALLDTSLREQVVTVKTGNLLTGVQLQTTLFRPAGDGPHPVVVINHGKAPGEPAYQRRYRPLRVVTEFVKRGYAVVVPMRQGFAGSSGFYQSAGCNFARSGLQHAQNIRDVIAWLNTQTDLDSRRLVIIGHSQGGLATLALGTFQLPNVVGLVNFAGGLRNDECTESGKQLASDVSTYASRTAVPSLWFYGSNDSILPVPVWQSMHRNYQQAGGKARLIAVGEYENDAHFMFARATGIDQWLPVVSGFFGELGLPFAPRNP